MSINAVQDEQNAFKLALSTRDPELLAKLRVDLFGTKDIQNMVRLAHLFYAEHGQVMGWDVLKSELDRRVTDIKKQEFLVGLVDDIKDRDISGLSSAILLKTLEGHRKLRVLLKSAGPLIDAVELKDVDGALGRLQAMYDEVHTEIGGMDMSSSDMVAMAGKSIQYNFRKTGIEGIDRRGGLIEGGLTILGAVAKAGKSTLASQFALHSHDNYVGSTAIFTFEQGTAEFRARILANRASIDIGLIMSKMLAPEEYLALRKAEAGHLCHYDSNMTDYIMETMHETDEEFWPKFFDHFQPRENRVHLFDHHPDWDELFVQMELLVKVKGVKMFVIDYPYLIARGSQDRQMASWEYNLLQNKNLKKFASRNKVWVITPAQYDAETDSLKFVRNAVNDCDMYIALSEEEGDADFQPAGAVTATFKAYRNFLSIPDEPQLRPFKMLREFQHSKFKYFNF